MGGGGGGGLEPGMRAAPFCNRRNATCISGHFGDGRTKA